MISLLILQLKIKLSTLEVSHVSSLFRVFARVLGTRHVSKPYIITKNKICVKLYWLSELFVVLQSFAKPNRKYTWINKKVIKSMIMWNYDVDINNIIVITS